jgi:hypothetical protein
MSRMKCCPKCGSTNISSLVFYRPSIWKCADCGYEGAFIIEYSGLTEKMQERYRKPRNITDEIEEEPRMDSWDGSIDILQKTPEDYLKSVITAIR